MVYMEKGTQKYCASLSECKFYTEVTLDGQRYNKCVDNCADNGFDYIDGETKKKCLSANKCVKYVLSDETTKLCYQSCEKSGNVFEVDSRCYTHCPP